MSEGIGNLVNIPRQHVDKAREVLKSLLGATIALHQYTDGIERYLTAELTGNYTGVRRRAVKTFQVARVRIVLRLVMMRSLLVLST